MIPLPENSGRGHRVKAGCNCHLDEERGEISFKEADSGPDNYRECSE